MICKANQWTGFFMIGTSFMKDLTAAACRGLYITPTGVHTRAHYLINLEHDVKQKKKKSEIFSDNFCRQMHLLKLNFELKKAAID